MKVWKTAEDDKVCGVCASLDGLPSGIMWDSSIGPESGLWTKGPDGHWHRKGGAAGPYGSPPLHPNCRCTVVELV